jgi:hypothetical protein
MQSHYEINVSRLASTGRKRYVHLFATAPRSCIWIEQARDVLRELTARFPAPEFQVTCTNYVCVGHSLAFDVDTEGQIKLVQE